MFMVDRNASCKQKYAPTIVVAADLCSDWKNLTRFYITRTVLYLTISLPYPRLVIYLWSVQTAIS